MKWTPSASEENELGNETVVPRRGSPTFSVDVLRFACPEDGVHFKQVNDYNGGINMRIAPRPNTSGQVSLDRLLNGPAPSRPRNTSEVSNAFVFDKVPIDGSLFDVELRNDYLPVGDIWAVAASKENGPDYHTASGIELYAILKTIYRGIGTDGTGQRVYELANQFIRGAMLASPITYGTVIEWRPNGEQDMVTHGPGRDDKILKIADIKHPGGPLCQSSVPFIETVFGENDIDRFSKVYQHFFGSIPYIRANPDYIHEVEKSFMASYFDGLIQAFDLDIMRIATGFLIKTTKVTP